MSHRVTAQCPQLFPLTGLANGEPIRSGTLATIADVEAHLLGAQLTQVCNIAYGPSELATGTIRVRHRASVNARMVAVCMVPAGETAGGTSGTVALSGATSAATKTVQFAATTADDLEQVLLWTHPVTSDALQDYVFTTTDVRPHALSIYEAPLGLLTDTDQYLDASFAFTSQFLTDDDTRGWGAALNNILYARRNMRRHLINIAWPYAAGSGGLTHTGARAYAIGSATADDGLRVRTRSGIGVDSGEILARFQIYVSDAGASSFTCYVTVEGGSAYNFTGINAAGWWPADPGLSIGIPEGGDEIKIEFLQDSGAGTLRVASIYCAEDFVVPV